MGRAASGGCRSLPLHLTHARHEPTPNAVPQHLGSRNSRLDGLRHIGIDELSDCKHHEQVTTVVDHERGTVVWTGKCKSAETLAAFFKALGSKRAARLESVTIDISGAYIKAVQEHAPLACMIFDRFPVQRIVQDARDETRRDGFCAAQNGEQCTRLKGMRVPTQGGPWHLTEADGRNAIPKAAGEPKSSGGARNSC